MSHEKGKPLTPKNTYPTSKPNIARYLLGFVFVAILLLASCTGGITIGGISPTPRPATATMTPTCSPDLVLATPDEWAILPRFVIILFDPNSNGSEKLEYLGDDTMDILEYIQNIIPVIIRPGDQVSVFRLGVRKYESAKVLGLSSDVGLIDFNLATPIPRETLVPVPTLGPRGSGSGWIPTGTHWAKTATAHSVQETRIAQEDNCDREVWRQRFGETATALGPTLEGNQNSLGTQAAATAQSYLENFALTETPYAGDVVYDGLWHASIDFQTYCKQNTTQDNPQATPTPSRREFERCILVIVDDLKTWGIDNPNDLPIALTDLDYVDILAVMPNCRDINQPSCTIWQDYWKIEILKYGGQNIEFTNGSDLENYLLDWLEGQ